MLDGVKQSANEFRLLRYIRLVDTRHDREYGTCSLRTPTPATSLFVSLGTLELVSKNRSDLNLVLDTVCFYTFCLGFWVGIRTCRLHPCHNFSSRSPVGNQCFRCILLLMAMQNLRSSDPTKDVKQRMCPLGVRRKFDSMQSHFFRVRNQK